VDGWPIVTLNVKVVDGFSETDVLGSWLSHDLEAAPSTIGVQLGFDQPALSSFKTLHRQVILNSCFQYIHKCSGSIRDSDNQSITSD
jgi:hypothetical protein